MTARSFTKLVLPLAVFAVAAWAVLYVGVWQWMVCRIYVEPGHSVVLIYKGSLLGNVPMAQLGQFAAIDEQGRPLERGVLREMLGPGRHFVSPLHYECITVKDVVVPIGKLAVVTCKVGDDPPPGSVLIDDPIGSMAVKGVLRAVLTPGRWRLNTHFAYDVASDPAKMDSAVVITPGNVGVVTNLADNPAKGETKGVQDRTLPAGLYYFNPREKKVDVIEVGYWAVDIAVTPDEAIAMGRTRPGTSPRDGSPSAGDRPGVNKPAAGVSGRPSAAGSPPPVSAKAARPKTAEPATAANAVTMPADDTEAANRGAGITFPSNDGFTIKLDVTAIWGVHPREAPRVVREFGSVNNIERNLILPQLNSIGRIRGSALSAVDLVVGETREGFQKRFAEDFAQVCAARHVQVADVLIRHIHAPLEVRRPIQAGQIAAEVRRTRDQEQDTARVEAQLEEARQKVTLEENRVDAETAKAVQQALAVGAGKVKEIDAQTARMAARLDAQTAENVAAADAILGEARAEVERLTRRAEADRFRLAVAAFAGLKGAEDLAGAVGPLTPAQIQAQNLAAGAAYNRWTFANALPEKLDLKLIVAGPGTFWTDLRSLEAGLMGQSVSQTGQAFGAGPMPSANREAATGPVPQPKR